MALNVWLISGGTNYYLSGGSSSQTVYAGSGTPWTAQTTTPYELSLNDATDNVWTASPAPTLAIVGGGAPFRVGQTLISKGYNDVTETVGIQCRATTHDNAVALKQQLYRILNTALFSVPCVLAFQPNGATNPTYYEISNADIQESTSYIYEQPSGLVVLRLAVTWTCTPLGGALSSGTSLLSSASFGNTGTGSPDDMVPYGALGGDFIYDGQPVNLDLTFSANTWQFCAATILGRTYDTSATGTALSTTSYPFGDSIAVTTAVDVSSAILTATKGRVLMRFTAPTSNLEVRIEVNATVDNTSTIVYRSPWIAPGTAATIVDFGGFSLDAFRDTNLTAGILRTRLYYRVTNGGTAGATIQSTTILFYYSFCNASIAAGISSTSFTRARVVTFRELSSRACLPYGVPKAFIYDAANTRPSNILVLRGAPPVYVSGASLWLMWYDRSGSTDDKLHTTTRTLTATATGAPLYATLRGGG